MMPLLVLLDADCQNEWKAGVGQGILGLKGEALLVAPATSGGVGSRSRPNSMRLSFNKGGPFDAEKTVESLVVLVLAVASDGTRFRSRASPGQPYGSHGV